MRNLLSNIKQLEHENVAQAWEMLKIMTNNYPAHGLSEWIIL